MSRSRSASAPFSTRSASAIVVLVVIVLFLGKVKVSQPNLTKTHDDRRFSSRPPLLHHYAGRDHVLRLLRTQRLLPRPQQVPIAAVQRRHDAASGARRA